ncbi:HNH endonuclease [bacterium]|nr:HNH endonuclease [bacterium]
MGMSVSWDARVRLAAFTWLEQATRRYGELLPRSILLAGFELDGQRIPLVSAASGIHKPRALEIPLSILTAPEVEGRERPYEDDIDAQGLIGYRYRGDVRHIHHRDNEGLRRAMQARLPMVYFVGIVPGRYQPFWPAYITGDDPSGLRFTVAIDDGALVLAAAGASAVAEDAASARRAYITTVARRRMHQTAFRFRVLTAYRERCTVCRLGHAELLDAAHIIPDSEPDGLPVVRNGLALCKLHHAAFDQHILGISPDYEIKIRLDVLEEEDGPMLVHGLQNWQGLRIHPPRQAELRPGRDLLEERYRRFLSR